MKRGDEAVMAVEVVYDPKKVSYKRLLGAYWRAIDPTNDLQVGWVS